MGNLWDHAPNRKHASADTAPVEPLSTVTANTPGSAIDVDPPDAAAESASASGPSLVEDDADGPILVVATPTGDQPAEPTAEKEASGPKIWDRRMVSAAAESTVNRLKKALSSDAHSETAPVDPLSRNHPLRVRVDALHQKAAKLLEAGELQEAKTQAERAVELSASLAMEFLPNEEHPEDLLHRITAAIDERDLAPAALVPMFPVEDTEVARPVSPRVPDESALTPFDAAPTSFDLNVNRETTPGTMAANRPLRLLSQSGSETEEQTTTDLVKIGPILGEEAHSAAIVDPVTAVGLAAPTAADRLRFRGDSGPLLLPTEKRPSTPKVADVAPLPAFPATVAPRQKAVDPDKPATGFEWSDLWPLAVLASLLLLFASTLVLRRVIVGH